MYETRLLDTNDPTAVPHAPYHLVDEAAVGDDHVFADEVIRAPHRPCHRMPTDHPLLALCAFLTRRR